MKNQKESNNENVLFCFVSLHLIIINYDFHTLMNSFMLERKAFECCMILLSRQHSNNTKSALEKAFIRYTTAIAQPADSVKMKEIIPKNVFFIYFVKFCTLKLF